MKPNMWWPFYRRIHASPACKEFKLNFEINYSFNNWHVKATWVLYYLWFRHTIQNKGDQNHTSAPVHKTIAFSIDLRSTPVDRTPGFLSNAINIFDNKAWINDHPISHHHNQIDDSITELGTPSTISQKKALPMTTNRATRPCFPMCHTRTN